MPKHISETSTTWTSVSSSVSSSFQKVVVQAPTSSTLLMELSGSGTIRSYVNSSGSYIQVSGVWDDVQGSFLNGQAPTGDMTLEQIGTAPALAYFFRHDQNNSASFMYQFPHGWDPTTDVKLHIHCVPMADPAGAQVVVFSGSYAWSVVSQTFNTGSSWTAFSSTHTVNTGDIAKQFVVPLATITPPGTAKESSILFVSIVRAGNDGADTYTTSKPVGTAAANVLGITADVHFRKTKAGTEIEFPAP